MPASPRTSTVSFAIRAITPKGVKRIIYSTMRRMISLRLSKNASVARVADCGSESAARLNSTAKNMI